MSRARASRPVMLRVPDRRHDAPQHRCLGGFDSARSVLAALALALAIVARAHEGAVATSDAYEVFARPMEHPDDGPRTIEADPALAGGVASPFGWHDTDGIAGAEHTITRGNNVHAYTDADADNLPDPGSAPDGGIELQFLFPLDLTADPAAYRPAAVTNAFYWCNVLHDVLYQHGFDEASGNFQENGYGRGGAAGDPVLVEVQEGQFTNGVTVAVQADGVSPRLQLGVFTVTTPRRDSALSSYAIAYAYSRAVTQRLVGGPLVTTCLTAAEATGMSIGWSDWIALVVTANASDAAGTSRGVGTYLMGQPPDGPGIRVAPYTTDLDVNSLTYSSIRTLPQPFGTGTVWGTALWQMYWALVEKHGFNSDLYADWTTGGNNLALRLVIDGMKLVPCNPGFVDGRDAILAADQNLTGGANRCEIWRAFAARGLGAGANQGSPSSISDGLEAFDVPPGCSLTGIGPAAGDERAGSSQRLTLDSNLPNPFTVETRIHFTNPRTQTLRLSVYDSQGRLVDVLFDGVHGAGAASFLWRASPDRNAPLGPGVYFLRLSGGGETITRKVILLETR